MQVSGDEIFGAVLEKEVANHRRLCVRERFVKAFPNPPAFCLQIAHLAEMNLPSRQLFTIFHQISEEIENFIVVDGHVENMDEGSLHENKQLVRVE